MLSETIVQILNRSETQLPVYTISIYRTPWIKQRIALNGGRSITYTLNPPIKSWTIKINRANRSAMSISIQARHEVMPCLRCRGG